MRKDMSVYKTGIHSKLERPIQTKTIGIIAYPGVEILDLTGPIEVFAFANTGLGMYFGAQPTITAYNIQVLAIQPGPVKASCGLQIIADKAYSEVEHMDTLIIPGAPTVDHLLADQQLQEWLKNIAPKVERLVSVCTGAFLLAKTGLLNGRRATSHWLYCDRLAREYPLINLEPDRIFTRDGHILTSGGITSGIDLCLSIIEEDLGNEVALMVARTLVVFLKRPGGQSQFSAYLTSAASRSEIKDLQAWIMVNLDQDLRVERLAEKVFMSPRNFARLFLGETGMTPAKFVELARIDAARHFLCSSKMNIDVIADKAGFADCERMRRAFKRQLGISPQEYRERFSASNVHTCPSTTLQ